MSSDSVRASRIFAVKFHCCSRGTRNSGPAVRSESCDVGVRGTYPSVVVGNGLEKVERLLLESALVNPWAKGTDVNSGAVDAFPLKGGFWKNQSYAPPATIGPPDPNGCQAKPMRGANLSSGAPFS